MEDGDKGFFRSRGLVADCLRRTFSSDNAGYSDTYLSFHHPPYKSTVW